MKNPRTLVFRTLALGAAAVAAASVLLLAGVFAAQAVQAPKMSLDMDPSGNGVSVGGFGGNVMAVGTIEQCATTNPGSPIPAGPFPPAPTFTTQLIIKDVEDLLGWQARFNYDGTKVGFSSFNETPFTSVINSAPIGFANLPFDLISGVHRGTAAPSAVRNAGTVNESVLFAAVYQSTQTFIVSADTPSKAVHDETTRTYDAPSGGVLADVIWTIRPGADGDPSVHLDLDDGDPNATGSKLTVFTVSGVTSIDLAESDLSDGFLGVNTPCIVPGGPAPTPTSTPTATSRWRNERDQGADHKHPRQTFSLPGARSRTVHVVQGNGLPF